MRIAVMGAGGQGILFGSLLVNAGHNVSFIARGKNLEALQEKGLTLKSNVFDEIKCPVNATDRPEDIGLVDLVFFCVKNYDLDEAVEKIKPLIGQETIVLTIQNGVEASKRTGEKIGHEQVIAGVSRTNSHLVAPGEVFHHGGIGLVFGESSGDKSQRVKNIEKVLKETGLNAAASDDINRDLWWKLSTLSGIHGVVCLTRSSIGVVRKYKETWELLRKVILETTCARASLFEKVNIFAVSLFSHFFLRDEP